MKQKNIQDIKPTGLPTGPYNHKEHESSILKNWLENKMYKPEFDPKTNTIQSEDESKNDTRERWSLICPPPNAYGRPHIGNISGYAYMDAMARFQRMQGKKVLMIPGKDHAGLEGEGVFVREVLEKQGRFKFDMSREDFYAEIMNFFQKNMQMALSDEQTIGLSADFDRDTFTLDEDIVETVLDTFIEMYQKKMIYKGVRIINYDTKARTAVADNQIEYIEAENKFFYFKYHLLDQTKRVWNLSFYNKEVLNALLDGSKTVETRALNPEEPDRYFGEIKQGDYINCIDKTTGYHYSFIAKNVRIYTNAKEYFEKEDLSKIWTGEVPKNYDEMIKQYESLQTGYGKKLEQNGIVAVELEKFIESGVEEALEIRNEFSQKTLITVNLERNKTSKGKSMPFVLGSITGYDTKNISLKSITLGYSENDLGKSVEVAPIGIMMRLDNRFGLITANTNLSPEELATEIKKAFEFEISDSAGAHHILFDEYLDDKFYTNGFVIGTVRPETIFADTAISCGSKDERYAQYVGKKVIVSFLGQVKELNFIEDYAVEKEFGTGLLKVTPAHATEDWEIAQRHKEECLPPIQVIDFSLKMTGKAGKYAGLKIKDARESMILDMKESGNLVYLDEHYKNRIQIAERTKAPIEPLMSSQWYLKYDGIKEEALRMINEIKSDGKAEIEIHPETMVKKFNHWMENLRDWAISRTLWWGYRLPVWYHGEIKEEIDLNGNVQELIKIAADSDNVATESTVLDIVRHAESEDNENDLVSGCDSSCSLSKKGRADTLGFEPKEKYDLIITSSVNRAVETAELINQKLNLEIVKSDLIIERCFGEAKGKICSQILKDYPQYNEVYDYLENEEIKGLEAQKDFEARLEKFVVWVKENYSGKRILVITHGEVKRQLARILNLMSEEEVNNWSPKNLEVTTALLKSHELNLSKESEKWIALEYDNPNHLRVQKHSPGHGWVQDEDVLDTWFSSGQWPFATLMKYNLMDEYFPTSVMVNAHDILENWDSRMIMFSAFKRSVAPFKHIFLTGLVKGTDGQKMSKSRGNLIDMDKIRDEYGTDAVRLAYFYQNSAGASYAVTYDKLKNFKHFINKLWNASRFVLMNKPTEFSIQMSESSFKLKESKEVFNAVRALKEKVTKNIKDFEFGHATDSLYEEFWHTFCDKHIEDIKKYFYPTKNDKGEVISEPTDEQRQEAGTVMIYALREYLKMLHPFIPFVTQRIWDEMPKVDGDHITLMYSKW